VSPSNILQKHVHSTILHAQKSCHLKCSMVSCDQLPCVKPSYCIHIIVCRSILDCTVIVIYSGAYHQGVKALQETHNDDMSKVAEDIFSHHYLSGKNSLAIKLIVSICSSYTCNIHCTLPLTYKIIMCCGISHFKRLLNIFTSE